MTVQARSVLHWRVSVGHALRQLSPEARKRMHGAPLTLLLLLWSRVRDPFAAAPVVVESYSSLAFDTGYAERTVQEAVRVLSDQGFLEKVGERAGVGSHYRLARAKADADSDLLAQRNPFDPRDSVEVSGLATTLQRATRKAAKKKESTGLSARELKSQRFDTLQRLQRTRKHVALALEYGDSVPENAQPRLVYSGKGAKEVNDAIDYLKEHTWADLLRVAGVAEAVGVPREQAFLSRHRKKVMEALDGDDVVVIGVTPSEQGESDTTLAVQTEKPPPVITDEMRRRHHDCDDKIIAWREGLV